MVSWEISRGILTLILAFCDHIVDKALLNLTPLHTVLGVEKEGLAKCIYHSLAACPWECITEIGADVC